MPSKYQALNNASRLAHDELAGKNIHDLRLRISPGLGLSASKEIGSWMVKLEGILQLTFCVIVPSGSIPEEVILRETQNRLLSLHQEYLELAEFAKQAADLIKS